MTVHIIDDDPSVTQGIAALVSTLGVASRSYGTAEGFLERESSHAGPGCLIVDLKLPGIDGIQFQELMAQRVSVLPMIVISAYVDVALAVRSMQCGALTVLEKPCDQLLLVDAIGRALEYSRTHHQKLEKMRHVQDKLSVLSPRERDVMERVVSGRSNKQIAGALDLALRSVERVRARILHKLGLDSATELAGLLGALAGRDMLVARLQVPSGLERRANRRGWE